jgi:repressor LexA
MERIDTLGNRLRQIMSERKLSYDKLGDLLGMQPQTLNRYVLGQREPKASVVMAMAAKLGVDERWLQGYDVPEKSDTATRKIPVVSIICPTANENDIIGWSCADVSNADEYVYLQVQGDSMINAGIYSNDLVLLHRQSHAENGQIIACSIGGNPAALMRYRKQGEFIILQPENANYEPHFLPASALDSGEISVVGVACKLVRDL